MLHLVQAAFVRGGRSLLQQGCIRASLSLLYANPLNSAMRADQ